MQLSRRSRIAPFLAMDVMEQARQVEEAGQPVIHMEVGQPATPAPRAATDRLMAEIAAGAPMGYTVALGLPDLRSGVARLYRARHGIDLDPARVVITTGSSAGFVLAFLALFDAGARVALAAPGYPAYRNILSALDLVPVNIETGLVTGYQPTVADLVAAEPVDGLLVASPANPTGTMLDAASMAALVAHCRDAGIAFISDEIYHGLTYSGPAGTALSHSDDVFVINSFAKYFSMTGWRVGWMVVPERFVRTIEALSQNLFICPPHPSQVAALGALDAGAELDALRDVYARNRGLLLDALPGLGFREIAPADGAFYVYADISAFTNDSRAFCARLLREGGVAATPGLDFDTARGHRTVRLSFARSTREIAEGLTRIAAFLARG